LSRETSGGKIKELPNDPEFKGVAVDIFNQTPPPKADWVSLPQLKAEYGDPFATPPDIYVLTKARGYVVHIYLYSFAP
jgi:hypothetical protein